MSVPNWDEGQILSWSGRWHIAGNAVQGLNETVALCGAGIYGYTRHSPVPGRVKRLKRIVEGLVEAPVCKHCLKRRKT